MPTWTLGALKINKTHLEMNNGHVLHFKNINRIEQTQKVPSRQKRLSIALVAAASVGAPLGLLTLPGALLLGTGVGIALYKGLKKKNRHYLTLSTRAGIIEPCSSYSAEEIRTLKKNVKMAKKQHLKMAA